MQISIVVKDSEVLPVKAGQEIRFPVEAKGKFTPLDKDNWHMEHTIGVNPGLSKIHLDDDSGAGVLLNKKKYYSPSISLIADFTAQPSINGIP